MAAEQGQVFQNVQRRLFLSSRRAMRPTGRGSICRLLSSHVAQCQDEISRWAGCEVEIADNSSCRPNWRLCVHRRDKLVGYLPEALLVPIDSVASERWYFECFANNKREVEKWLSTNCNNGTYLVWADDEQENFVLSNRNAFSQIRHFVIGEHERQFFLNLSQPFDSLPELIEFYEQHVGHFVKHLHLKDVAPRPKWTPPLQGTLCCSGKIAIDRESLQLMRMERSGFAARVYSGVHRQTAVLVTEIGSDMLPFKDVAWRGESLKQLVALSHENVHHVLGVCLPEGAPKALLISEKPPLHSTLEWYLLQPPRPLSKLACADILCQVAAAMEYLSSHSFVHTALSSRHILIGDNYCIKVTDLYMGGFSGSRHLAERIKYPFSLRKSAPELVFAREPTSKSDVWSFGALMFEMFSQGRAFFADLSDKGVLQALMNDIEDIVPPPPRSLPDFLANSYRLCLLECPFQRPSFQFLRMIHEQFVLEVYRNTMG